MKTKQHIHLSFNRRHALAVLLIFAVLAAGCNGDREEPAPPVKPATGFTFFDLGAESVYSKALRKKLESELGSDAIATRTIIDLSINYQGFLQAHFPDLHDFNLRLNNTTGARVEHNTTKLMYRYPHRNNRPFRNVELMFSNYTQKPLLFIVRTDKQESTILNTLIDKYGEPVIHQWGETQGMSHHWQKGKDILILSQSLNRIGNPEFHIHIYFVNNMNELLSTEKKEALKREQERKRMGREAF